MGEFSFIIAGLGQSLSVTGAFLYPIIVAVSVVTTFTTPLALKFATPLCRWLEQVLPERWVEGLEHYAQARQRKKPGTDKDWTLFLRNYGRTFGLFGVLSVGAILL